MSDKLFIVWLSDKDFLVVYIYTVKGIVKSYTVKHISIIDNNEYEIARFDSGHDACHLDILRPDGSKDRIIKFPQVTDDIVIDFAVDNFKANFDLYRERFEKWLKKRK